MNRRLVTVGLLACIGFSLALALAPTAEAQCRPPRIVLKSTKGEVLRSTQGERGSTLTVEGEFFWLTCIHESIAGATIPRPEPAKSIRIRFKQNNQSAVLATVDADTNLRFAVTVTIPASATIGVATLTADYSDDSGLNTFLEKFPIAFEVVESDKQNKN